MSAVLVFTRCFGAVSRVTISSVSLTDAKGQTVRATAGFTLIEMVIVVAILGVLSAIAIPNFINYSLRAKTAEAFLLIGSIVTSEETFAAEFENYVAVSPHPATVPGSRKVIWTNRRCSTDCTRKTPASCTEYTCIGFEPPARVYFQYATTRVMASSGVPPEYAVGAAADLNEDGVNGTFAYRSKNYGGMYGIIHDGISHCPADIIAQTITRCNPRSY